MDAQPIHSYGNSNYVAYKEKYPINKNITDQDHNKLAGNGTVTAKTELNNAMEEKLEYSEKTNGDIIPLQDKMSYSELARVAGEFHKIYRLKNCIDKTKIKPLRFPYTGIGAMCSFIDKAKIDGISHLYRTCERERKEKKSMTLIQNFNKRTLTCNTLQENVKTRQINNIKKNISIETILDTLKFVNGMHSDKKITEPLNVRKRDELAETFKFEENALINDKDGKINGTEGIVVESTKTEHKIEPVTRILVPDKNISQSNKPTIQNRNFGKTLIEVPNFKKREQICKTDERQMNAFKRRHGICEAYAVQKKSSLAVKDKNISKFDDENIVIKEENIDEYMSANILGNKEVNEHNSIKKKTFDIAKEKKSENLFNVKSNLNTSTRKIEILKSNLKVDGLIKNPFININKVPEMCSTKKNAKILNQTKCKTNRTKLEMSTVKSEAASQMLKSRPALLKTYNLARNKNKLFFEQPSSVNIYKKQHEDVTPKFMANSSVDLATLVNEIIATPQNSNSARQWWTWTQIKQDLATVNTILTKTQSNTNFLANIEKTYRCCSQRLLTVLKVNLYKEVIQRIRVYKPDEIVLLVSNNTKGFYHIGICKLQQSKFVNCLLATKEALIDAEKDQLYVTVRTYFFKD